MASRNSERNSNIRDSGIENKGYEIPIETHRASGYTNFEIYETMEPDRDLHTYDSAEETSPKTKRFKRTGLHQRNSQSSSGSRRPIISSISEWPDQVTPRKVVMFAAGISLLCSLIICIISGFIVYHVISNSKAETTDSKEMMTMLVDKNDTIQQLQKLENDLKALQATTNSRGTTYIRWGRTSCQGNGTQLVYSGYAGGSFFNHTGAAANYLCLPEDPIWGKYEDHESQYTALVFGAEYEITESVLDNVKLNDDVPCAVCRSPRTDVLMIPARNDCYSSWSLEYSGYLMAGAHFQKAASEYVCLDGEPESIGSGTSDHNGKLFYQVETRCGPLQCPPYVEGRELTCVVCSK